MPIPTPSLASLTLLETMRLEAGIIHRVDRHLARMRKTAADFGHLFHEDEVRTALGQASRDHQDGCWRTRLTVDADGVPLVECTPHADSDAVWRVAFAPTPIDDEDPLIFNKTTSRHQYDRARRARPDVDDVVLWNPRGEVTESTIANLVAELDGVRCTPPVACGLLAGVFRGELVESGQLVERVLRRGTVAQASRLWIVNSLRGWVEATLVR